VLSELSPDLEVRKQLVDLSGTRGSHGFLFIAAFEKLSDQWPKLPEAQKVALEKDLKKLFPFALDKSGDAYIHAILSQAPRLQGAKLTELYSMAVQRFSPELRTQLADYWVTYTVLGIPDFHPNNWLMLDQKIIGIDLAHKPQSAKKDTDPLMLSMHQHPYGQFEFTREVRSILMGSISPELKRYLSSLTRDKIQAIAKEAQYPISSKELDQIESRIRTVAGGEH
jgi:hypothetical protein